MTKDLINRITYYLSSGGLFNPELADHLAVRNLLMECREALAQPEQEPVAFINVEQRKLEWAKYMTWDTPTVVNLPKIPLYATPPQRKPHPDEFKCPYCYDQSQRKPLSDEEIADTLTGYRLSDAIDITRAIEAAHGIKE